MDAKAWAVVALVRMRLPPRALHIWTWVLLLAPLAWVGGLGLRYHITTHTWPEAALNRAGALHKASLEARRQGLDVSGWQESIELHANPALDAAMHDKPPAFQHWLYENAPPRSLSAGFENHKTGEKISYDLNLRGEVTGFRTEVQSGGDCRSAGLGEEQLAREIFLRRFAPWPQFHGETASRSEINVSGQATRIQYSWRVQVPEMPEVPLRFEADIVCGHVAGERVSPDLSEQPPAQGVHVTKDPASGIYGALAVFYFFIAIPWIAVRYIKRSLQREAPQGRILLAGGLDHALAVGDSRDRRAVGAARIHAWPAGIRLARSGKRGDRYGCAAAPGFDYRGLGDFVFVCRDRRGCGERCFEETGHSLCGSRVDSVVVAIACDATRAGAV